MAERMMQAFSRMIYLMKKQQQESQVVQQPQPRLQHGVRDIAWKFPICKTANPWYKGSDVGALQPHQHCEWLTHGAHQNFADHRSSHA